MGRQRSIFSLILVIVATFLFGCSGPSVAKAPQTYTASQLQKIQEYSTEIIAVRDRGAELEDLIEKQDWRRVGNFIHGPMTEARLAINYVAPNLLPQEQKEARKISKDMLNYLVKIDKAAESGDRFQALNSYSAVYADIDRFLKLLPETQTGAISES